MKKEREYKFSPPANKQFKFTTLEPAATVAHKAMAIFNLMGIPVRPPREIRIRDTYLDTPDGVLGARGISVRLRREDGQARITIKVDSAHYTEAMTRYEDEFEVPAEMTPDTVPPELVRSRLGDRFGLGLSLPELRPTVEINNRRLLIEFRTQSRYHKFCYDKFHAVHLPTRTYGHLSSEVEFEVEAKEPEKDGSLQTIIDTFAAIFFLEPSHRSKLKRSLDHLSKPEVRVVHTVGLDIIGYTTRSDDLQAQMIQCLNKYTKDAIQEHSDGEPVHEIYIPTGDGMLIAFDNERAAKIIPILCVLQKSIRAWCRQAPTELQFAFRTAVHTGPVFKYSDINENLNYAGAGINQAARLLTLGADWTIIFSESARDVIGATQIQYKRCFTSLGKQTVKQSEISACNFYDPITDTGRANWTP